MVSTSNQYDIVIAGGGMVGLSLALMLVQEMPALRVAIVERAVTSNQPAAAGNSFDSRSTAVSAGSVELLDAMGLWQPLVRQATAIKTVDVSDRGHLGRTHYSVENSRAQHALGALGYVVDNAHLGQALAQAVKQTAQITLFCPATVTAVTPKAQGTEIAVQMTEGQQAPQLLHAQLLIIADGAESGLRKQLGIGANINDYGQHAVIANLHHSKPHQCVAYERFTEQGPMALLPRGGGERGCQSALVWTRPESQLEQTLALTDNDFLAQIQDTFGYRLGGFQKVSTRHHYPLKLSLAKEQVRSGVVLVGNAAHFLHPVAGQGFNLAVRDCAQLTAALALAHKHHTWLGSLHTLQAYMAKQSRDQFATTMLSHSFNSLFSNNRKPLQLLRNIGLLGLQAVPLAQQDFFDQMMGRGMARAELNLLQRYLLRKQGQPIAEQAQA